MPEIAFRLQARFVKPEDAPKLVVIRLNVGSDFGLDMLPYPTALRSCVSRQAAQDILDKVGQTGGRGSRLRLTGLRIAGQPVPDLDVVPSLAPGRLQVDGFLGLDFFEQFDVVEWRPTARLMRLIVADRRVHDCLARNACNFHDVEVIINYLGVDKIAIAE